MERRSRQSVLSSLRSVMPPLVRSKSLKSLCAPPSPTVSKASSHPSPRLVSLPRSQSQPLVAEDDGLHMESTPSPMHIKSAKEALHQGPFSFSESCLGKIDSVLYDIIPGKLYITFHPNQTYTKQEIIRHPELFFMSTTYHESYAPFAKDFGPVDIGVVFRFCEALRAKASNPNLRGRPIVYYTRCNVKQQTNAVLLLAMYLMVEHDFTAESAAACFRKIPEYPFVPFCDASHEPEDLGITIHECLSAFEKAKATGWFDVGRFDCRQYELACHRGGGDMCVIGDKFVASRSPQRGPSHSVNTTAFYARRFVQLGVSAVVRLNDANCYDEQPFVDAGIEVVDVPVEDGGCPTAAGVKQFLDLCDDAKGVVAVHCHAGLGRTGTMIAVWMIKHLHMSAMEAIAWIRILRPGSIVGAQKHFLLEVEKARWEGNTMLPRLGVVRSKSWPLTGLGQGWRSLAGKAKKEHQPAVVERDESIAPRPKAQQMLRRKTLVRLSHPGIFGRDSPRHSPSPRSPIIASAATTPLTLSVREGGLQQGRRASVSSHASRRSSM